MRTYEIKAWTSTGEDEVTIIALIEGTDVFVDILVDVLNPEQVKGLRVWGEQAIVANPYSCPLSVLLDALVGKKIISEFNRAA